jgi:hypothetical protein
VILGDQPSQPAAHTGKPGDGQSVPQAAVAELEAQKRRAEVERFRAELRKANARAREEAALSTTA